MDKEAMKQLIQQSLTQKLGSDYHISIRKALKTNLKLDGLTILRDGTNCTPTIYLDPFYEELKKGASIDDVIDGIIQLYFCAGVDIQNFDATPIIDFNYVKSRLYVQLINRHFNTELLQNVPHSVFLDDFAVVIRCLVNMTSDEHASFLIHQNHLRLWNVDQETLLSIAVKNTKELFGIAIHNMNDLLEELLGCPATGDTQPPIWVMSNERRIAGATTVLFDDVLKKFADVHGSFYIIFSSVHEVLLLPASWYPDTDILTQMNQEVNVTQLSQDEVLGTHAYFYDKEKGFVL